MYSSGGDLHLELPTGQQGGTGKLWVSPPRPRRTFEAMWHRYEPAASSCFAGDPPVRDQGGDESQLLVQGRGQPHGFHQDQNQRPRRGPVHHPPSGGGGHLRCGGRRRHLSVNTSCPLCAVRLMLLLPPSSAAPGIYSSTEMLDFGTLRSQGANHHPHHLQFSSR